MRILNIVSSNIVQDPRVLKQIETIKGVTNDYKIVGMNNSQATNKRLENLDCNYRLLGSKVDPKNILSKLGFFLKTFLKNEIARWIKIQEDIGLDVLVHGEFERNDMVEFFGEKLQGFLVTKFGWVQSYGSRAVKPPIIYGDVKWTAPLTVDETVYAQSLTDKPVKGMLTGPVTILNWFSNQRRSIST